MSYEGFVDSRLIQALSANSSTSALARFPWLTQARTRMVCLLRLSSYVPVSEEIIFKARNL